MQDWQLRPGLALLHHQRRLTSRFATRLGRSDAEDLASEAIARGLARPAPDGRQEPWIETIFRNLLVDARRQLGRRGGRAEALVDEPVDRGASPEDILLRRERGHAVASVLPAIPTELREALVARFYDDQDYDQMAATSGISVTTARTRVCRALARLRQSLESMRAWLPGTFGSGTPLAAAWLPAVAVAVLAIGPGIDVGAGRVTAGQVISDSGGAPATTLRAAIHRPSITLAATIQPRHVLPGRAVAHAPKGTVAANPANADKDAEEEAVKPLPVQRFVFDGDEVTGDQQQPGILLVNGTPREAKLDSLIEIPRSFLPSMTKMVEDN
jgi:RNA polymerase sigma factor (sigma-70 family)